MTTKQNERKLCVARFCFVPPIYLKLNVYMVLNYFVHIDVKFHLAISFNLDVA